MQNQLEKAFIGFDWVLQKIESKKNFAEDEDLLELWGMVKNLYAQTLMKADRYPEAKTAFLEALTVYRKFHDEVCMKISNLKKI